MSASVVCVNIDSMRANMDALAKMIKGVVSNMQPTMICMCEVGENTNPLSQQQLQQVADEVMRVWSDAATEHIQLCSMFTTGASYATVYKDGPIRCSRHRILRDLYEAHGGEPCTAQTFVCSFPSGESMDVVNVHAPSGTGNKRRLKDSQRRQLLTNLLQSSSQASAMAGANIGYAHFLIGGDMNAKKADLTQVLQTCRESEHLHTKEQMHERDGAKHADLCVSAGIEARTLKETASHVDPQHEPYGV